MYIVEYEFENQVSRNNFIFDHEAKHFAIDIAYEGFKPFVYEFNKLIGRIDSFGSCKIFVRV